MPRTGPEEEGRQYMLKRAMFPNLQGDSCSGFFSSTPSTFFNPKGINVKQGLNYSRIKHILTSLISF